MRIVPGSGILFWKFTQTVQTKAACGRLQEKGRVNIAKRRIPGLRPCLWDGVVVLAVVAAAVSCRSLFQTGGGETAVPLVTVRVDGEEVYRGLPQSGPEGDLRICGYGDYVLQVRFEERDGKPGVRVADADCPGRECVHTGLITRVGESIVCLPARTVIRLEGRGDTDLVSG